MEAFFDDLNVPFPFGPFRGRKLRDVPDKFLAELEYGSAYEAWIRIINRRGITKLYTPKTPAYIPPMVSEPLPCINLLRDSSLNPSLFGSFIEYLAKYALGLRQFNEVEQFLSVAPLSQPRTRYISSSYGKRDKDILDLCNLSFCHALTLGHFNERDATNLYNYIKSQYSFFERFYGSICDSSLPRLKDTQQRTGDNISVGVVVGSFDIITSDAIIDIKCCSDDNTDEYRQQLFGYYCLHRLRYPHVFKRLQIINFLTGKVFTMNVADVPYGQCVEHIKYLGSFEPLHLKLF